MLADPSQRDADGLSGRQEQCLALASKGMTSKEIAREIGISPSTVDNHLRVAMLRLGARNRREAAELFRDSIRVALDDERPGRAEEPSTRNLNEAGKRPESALDILGLPPLGGTPNQYSIRQKLWLVSKIALMGTMLLAAIGFTISGLITVFDR